MRHPYFALPTPIVMGHRGAAGEVPENTLLSFETAVAQGAAILESDVRATRDGHIVVFHDERLERTTNGSGRVVDYSLEELRGLDGGHRFSPASSEVFPFRGRGLRIPTLKEAFEALPGLRFNLEVKEGDREVVKRIVETVKRAGREELTLLTAGKDEVMATLRSHLAESGVPVALGACPADVVAFIRSALEGMPAPPEPMALQIPAEFAGRPVVTPELVHHAHANDVHVHVWTINEVEEMQRLLDLGVDGIVTDFPARLAELIAERRAGSQASPGS
jgi:glycerophosphoryl diester phosphodiesterase